MAFYVHGSHLDGDCCAALSMALHLEGNYNIAILDGYTMEGDSSAALSIDTP